MKKDIAEILVVGDMTKAFPEHWQSVGLPFTNCIDIDDAIAAAASREFSIIMIILVGLVKPEVKLKSLRANCINSKLVLISPIPLEQTALKLVKVGLADNYFVSFSEFCSIFTNLPVDQDEIPSDYQSLTRIGILEKLATEDELTGLKNRRYLWEFSRQVINLARKEKSQITLLVFDIDDFKHYNDMYSHSVGDKILKQAAVLIKRCCRSQDIVARIGGDEFAVVFWDLPVDYSKPENERRTVGNHPQEVLFIAKRFMKELEQAELPFLGSRGKGTLTISGGLATFPRDGQSVEELFMLADEALLDAKGSGKNKIYLVDSESGSADIG